MSTSRMSHDHLVQMITTITVFVIIGLFLYGWGSIRYKQVISYRSAIGTIT